MTIPAQKNRVDGHSFFHIVDEVRGTSPATERADAMWPGDANASVYQAVVNHRLEHVGEYLRSFRQGQPDSAAVPLWSLRALQQESVQAGHDDLSDLCVRMELGIMVLHARRGERLDALASEIACMCEHIKRRACGGGLAPADLVEPPREASAA